jgi:hypothetical protein
MGMSPPEEFTAGMEVLDGIEKYLHIRYPGDGISSSHVALIKALRKQFAQSDKKTNELLFKAIGFGLAVGISAPGPKGSKQQSFNDLRDKFDQTGNTKASRAPGVKGPGRKTTEITRAMEILATKIPPPAPYLYDHKKFREDLNTHYSSIQDIIKPVGKGSQYIYPLKADETSKPIEEALKVLKRVAKRNK